MLDNPIGGIIKSLFPTLGKFGLFQDMFQDDFIYGSVGRAVATDSRGPRIKWWLYVC